MDNKNYLKIYSNLFMIIKKIFSFIVLIQYDKNLFKKIAFSKNDKNLLKLEFKNILIEQHEEYFEYIINEEESIIEKNLNK